MRLQKFPLLFSLGLLIIFIAFPLNIINAVPIEFTQAYVYNEGTYYRARAVAAADIDEDGDQDVIVGDSYYDDLLWYKNNGSETFTKTTIDSTYYRAAQIEIMDLDEDGDLDIIGGDNDNYAIFWWENDGLENFTEQTVSTYGSDFSIADIDKDGDYDFVATDWSSGLYWVENDGSENFTNNLIDAGMTAAWTACTGDMTGDTEIDIVMNKYNSNLYLWTNDGSENFTSSSIDTGNTAKTIICVDLDEDSDLDVIAPGSYGHNMNWYRNNGSGTFTEIEILGGTGYGTDDFKVSDLDGDGDLDIITADDTQHKVLWFDNDGSENFTERTVDSYYFGVTTVDTEDIDDNGTQDVVAGSYENGQDVMWFSGALDGSDPVVDTLSPADDAPSAATNSNLVITFNEAVDAETGFIKLYKADTTLIESFDVTTDISGDGTTTITANPASDMDEETGYYVQIDATAFDDESSNSFAGILDQTTWSFTTADETNPLVDTLSPVDDITGVAVGSNLVVTFDELVNVETGNVTIKKTHDDFTVETINIALGQVTGDGTDTITIDPGSDFGELLEYYVQIDATAIDDIAGNSFAGITDSTTWSFTTTGTAGVTVSAISGNTTEAAGTATFTVELDTEPTENVTIPVSSSNTDEGTVSDATLTFTSANWDTPQTITVTGVDDDIDDGDIAYTAVLAATTSSDANYNGINPSDVSVTNTDNDTSGITVGVISGDTAETATTATFTVVLDSEPTNNVTIPVSSSDTGEGTVSTDTLTFTSANWDTPQTITVTGVDDDIDDGNQSFNAILGLTTSVDGNYNGVNPGDVSVTNTDDDTAGITKSETALTVTEGSTTDTYTIVLDTEPTNDVVVTLSDTNSEISISPETLTLTSANWSTPQTVTVTAINDDVAESSQSDTITHSVSSSDANYNGFSLSNISVSITDNDTAGITKSETILSVIEGSTTDTYTINLNTEPTNNVTISITDTNSEISISPETLTFTSANWDTAQTITVTATDDSDVETSQSDTITHLVSSTDSNYNNYSLADISVSITDNDEEEEEEPESPDEDDDDEEEEIIEKKEEVGKVKNKKKGKGKVTIYDKDNQVHCSIFAWNEGGAIGKFIRILDQDYLSVVKNKHGTTLHLYDLNCNLVVKKTLSKDMHPRRMVTRNFIGGSNSQEIAIASRRGSTVYIKMFRYNIDKNEWYLLRTKLFKPVPKNYTLNKTKKGNLRIKNKNAKTLHKYKVKKKTKRDTKIII